MDIMTGGAAKQTANELVGTTSVVAIESAQAGLFAAGDKDATTLTVDVSSLLWTAGAYADHRQPVQERLAVCLQEYEASGYLSKQETHLDPKATAWITTSAFLDMHFLFKIYPDIAQYVVEQKLSMNHLQSVGVLSNVTIYISSKRLPFNITQRLSNSCIKFGIRDPTKTDAEKRFNVLSFAQVGHIALQNAFIAEGQRRKRRSQPQVVPVLGRILALISVCGIGEVTLSEIRMFLLA